MSKKWKTVKQDVDLLIETAYKAKYNFIECPPKEEVWANIKENLVKPQKRSVKKRNMIAAVSLLVFTGLFFVSNYYTSADSFTSKIIKKVINYSEDTITILKKVDIIKGTEFDSSYNLNFDDPRLSETQSIIHFDLSVPKYLPEGYYLKSIKVLNDIREHEMVTLCYASNSTDDKNTENNCIYIEQEFYTTGVNFTFNIHKPPDTEIKEIIINENECLLFLYKNGFSKILWEKDNKNYMIHGKISEDEIIKIAKSMK